MRQLEPTFVLLGGCLLAFGASFINVGFLLQTGVSVSHLTGDISKLATNLVRGEESLMHSVPLVSAATVSFVFGATVSGFLLQHPTLEIERPYGRLIAAIGCLLIIAYFAGSKSDLAAISLSGFSCGLQNALATRYRGIILRTTHVTGLFTDLGSALGMKLRGHRIETWKLSVPLFLSLSFFCGAMASAAFFTFSSRPWLLVAGLAYLVGGASWSLIKRLAFSWGKSSRT